MENNVKEGSLCKIVYFDEESVTDYIQIVNNGNLEKTSELLGDTVDSVNGSSGISGKIGVMGALKVLLGNEISASANAEINTSYTNERMVKTIVKNTILTDFINIVTKNKNKAIVEMRGYKIEAPKDSLAYVALISPYFNMLRGANIPAGEFTLATDKLDNTIKSAKGYYEFLGTKINEEDIKTVILRFNIKSFKNNYKPTDLLKMDMCIYAIKVGESTKDMLNFANEFNISTTFADNPSYHECDNFEGDTTVEEKEELDVYDVLLAGVEYNED